MSLTLLFSYEYWQDSQIFQNQTLMTLIFPLFFEYCPLFFMPLYFIMRVKLNKMKQKQLKMLKKELKQFRQLRDS